MFLPPAPSAPSAPQSTPETAISSFLSFHAVLASLPSSLLPTPQNAISTFETAVNCKTVVHRGIKTTISLPCVVIDEPEYNEISLEKFKSMRPCEISVEQRKQAVFWFMNCSYIIQNRLAPIKFSRQARNVQLGLVPKEWFKWLEISTGHCIKKVHLKYTDQTGMPYSKNEPWNNIVTKVEGSIFCCTLSTLNIHFDLETKQCWCSFSYKSYKFFPNGTFSWQKEDIWSPVA